MANYDQSGNPVGGTQQGGGQGGTVQGGQWRGGQGQQSQYAGGTEGQQGRYGASPQQTGRMQQGGRERQEGNAQAGGRMQAYGGGMFPDLYSGFGGNPFQLISRISDEMDRIFDVFGMGDLAPGVRGGAQRASLQPGRGQAPGMRELWAPRIEMCERDGKLLIQADLPGVRKEDVNVQIEDDAVILQGQRHQENTRDEQGFYHSERSYGSFYRVIPLPEGVDAEQAHASYRDGVLQIELPAPQPRQRGRRLEIRDGGTREGPAGTAGTAGASTASGSSSTPTGQERAEGSSERR